MILKKIIYGILLLSPVVMYANEKQEELDIANLPLTFFSECFIDQQSEAGCWQQIDAEAILSQQYDFGVHYINGDGTTQDFSKGRYWIHKAALNGYPLAQYNLGVMFFDGIGGIQSRECASYWLNKAALDTADVKEMASQALAAINSQPLNGLPKVYRVLTSNECELVPDVEAPIDDVETSIDKSDIFVFDTYSAQLSDPYSAEPWVSDEAKLKAEVDISTADISNNLDVDEDATDKVIPGYFRQKIGQYFIQLGHMLLREDDIPAEPVDKTQAENITPPDAEINSLPAENSTLDVITSDDLPDDLQIEINNKVPESLAEPLEQQVEIAPKKKFNALNLGGDLQSASKGHYTLQLSSASQAEPLLFFAKKQKLSNYLVYETQRHGRRWHVLVYGEYTGMKQAKQALQQLPSGLKKDSPWIRSLADVQTEL